MSYKHAIFSFTSLKVLPSYIVHPSIKICWLFVPDGIGINIIIVIHVPLYRDLAFLWIDYMYM